MNTHTHTGIKNTSFNGSGTCEFPRHRKPKGFRHFMCLLIFASLGLAGCIQDGSDDGAGKRQRTGGGGGTGIDSAGLLNGDAGMNTDLGVPRGDQGPARAMSDCETYCTIGESCGYRPEGGLDCVSECRENFMAVPEFLSHIVECAGQHLAGGQCDGGALRTCVESFGMPSACDVDACVWPPNDFIEWPAGAGADPIQCNAMCVDGELESCVCQNDGARHGTLLDCAEEARCEFEFSVVEGDSLHVNGDARCLLEGLRDRTPGLYRYRVGNSHSSGADSREFLIWIQTDGRVTYSEQSTGHGQFSFPEEFYAHRDYSISEISLECSLPAADYFQSCLDAYPEVEPSRGDVIIGSTFEFETVKDCLYGTVYGGERPWPWFTDCTPKVPVCD